MKDQLQTIREDAEWINNCNTGGMLQGRARNILTALDQLEAMVGEQEPFAYVYSGIRFNGELHGPHLIWNPREMDAMSAQKGAKAEPLYTAAPVAQQPQAEPDDEILKERDDAEDFIDMLLDEVLGTDRPEWTSAYGRDDALRDVQERMTALHKPMVDKAWERFEKAQQPQAEADYKGWYCAHCQRGVDSSEVTYHEQHTVCGRVITNDRPPKQPQAEAVPPDVVRDAERYRWIKEQSAKQTNFYSGDAQWCVSREQGGMGQNFFGDRIDAAIDAAIAQQKGGEA